MKKGILAFLWILIIFFSYKIYDSINGPIEFNETKNNRYAKVINRLKIIVKNYDETIFIEEALHRLVEINYHLGLENEAKKYASLLGYNYQSSEWYEKSYKIFNKKYMTKNELKKEKEGIFKKFKRLLK